MNRLVALALPPGKAFVEELERAFGEGDAILPLDLRLAETARERLIAAMAPAVVVESPGEHRELTGALPVEDGDALVLATSGTTGEPKGVVLTHDAIDASARATNDRLAVDAASDAWWCCLPLAHIGGLSVILRARMGGVRCDVEGYSPAAAARALFRGATLTSLVPTALGRLDPEVAAGFRRILLGGQAPPDGLPSNVVTTYGMTETGSGVVYDGWPLDGVEVRVEGGEVLVRGPMLLRSYRDGTDPFIDGAWLPTGDAGELAPDGRLTVFGRRSDLVISGGENVWPAAVEHALRRHPAVEAVAVTGRPDEEWGEHVAAFVVLQGGSDVEAAELLGELRELVREEVAPFAAPREIVIVERLPLTALGKVQRDALTALEGPSVHLGAAPSPLVVASPSPGVQIRPVRPSEYEVVGRLVVAAYAALAGTPLSDEYAAELADVAHRAVEAEVFVAEDSVLLGCATLVPDASSPWAELLKDGEAGLRMLAVDPAAQGRGVGRALLQACIERARELGRSALFLHSTPWMPAAHRLYERAGFLREQGRDWTPVPEVPLLAYRLDLTEGSR
ncbi:MAG: GNAT family N-acetyltransferase, partial [Acidimicrobiales bacterium]